MLFYSVGKGFQTGTLRQALVDLYRTAGATGLTDAESAFRLSVHAGSVRKVRKRLEDTGMVAHTGRERLNMHTKAWAGIFVARATEATEAVAA